MSNTMKVKVNKKTGTVNLKLIRRDVWGRIRKQSSFTMSIWEFNQSMTNAQIEVPWRELLQR